MTSIAKRGRLLPILVGVALNFLAYALFTLVVPLFALGLDQSPRMIGELVSVGFLVQIMIAMPLGAVIDRSRYGVGVAIVLGPLLIGVGCFVLVALPTAAGIAVAELVVGMGQISLVLSSQTETALLRRPSGSAGSFGAFAAAVALGQTVGPYLGGIAISNYGTPFALALGGLSASLASMVLLAGQLGRRRLAATREESLSRSRGFVSLPVFRYAIVVSAAAVLARVAYTTFLPVYLRRSGFSAASIGEATALLGLVTFLVRPSVARFASIMRGELKAMAMCTIATGVGVLLIALSPSWAVLLTMTLLVGFGAGFSQPLSMATVAGAVTERERGIALASRLITNRLTQVIGPLALGLLAGGIGLRAVFILAGGGILGLGPVLGRYAASLGDSVTSDS